MTRPSRGGPLLLSALLMAWSAPSSGDTAGGARAPVTMRDPGPDLGGDFPNSGSVVPVGGLYVEAGVFGGYTVAFDYTRAFQRDAFVSAVLLRYGIVPGFELRGTAVLYSHVDQPGKDLEGTGPVEFGFKYCLVDPHRSRRGTAVAFEVDVVLPWASADLEQGRVEPSLQFNADHPLPAGFSLHWNAGVSTAVDDGGDLFAQANFQWSAAKDLGKDLTVYLTGVFLDPDTKPDGTAEIVVGAGFRWYPGDRTSLQVTLASGFRDVRGGGVQISAGFAF